MLPARLCDLNYPKREDFEQLSKRRLVAICKLAWLVRKEKYDCRYTSHRKHDWELNCEQLAKLFCSFKSEKYRVLFRLQFLLALRIGEVIGLRWCDVEEREKRVWVLNSKNGTREHLPLLPEVKRLLHNWRLRSAFDLGLSGWVFPAVRGGHVCYVLADKRFKEAVRRGNLPDWVHPHCLRHSRLSQFYRFSKNWELTRLFARHINASTTFEYYVHASSQELEAGLRAFSAVPKN